MATFHWQCLRLRHNGVQLSMTEPLSLAEPLNFYADILLCFEKGLLKCISTTHFLKKDQARIWNIVTEQKKEEKEKNKSGMQSFFKGSPSPLEISPLLFADDLILQSSIYFFSPSSSSSFFFCHSKFVFRLHKIAFSYFKQQCMQWKIFHIIYP